MSNPEKARILPKLGKKSPPDKSKLPGTDTVGVQPRLHKKGDTDKNKPAYRRGVSTLFEKYVDKRTGSVVVALLVEGTGFTKKNLAGTLGISVDAMSRKDRINSPTTQVRIPPSEGRLRCIH